MRSLLGLVGLDLGVLVSGGALLYGAGLVRTRGAIVRFAGLAFALGWAALGVLAAAGLAAGLSLSVWQAGLALAGLTAVGLIVGRRTPSERAPQPREAPGRAIGLAALAAVAGYAGLLLWRSVVQGAPAEWDAWAVWVAKAKTIAYFGGIDTASGGFTSFAHPHYPPLVPGMDALVFSSIGSVDPTYLPFQGWLLFASFVAAVAAMLYGRIPTVVLGSSVAALAVMPALTRLIGSGLADLPLAIMFALAALASALWLVDRSNAYLAVAAVLVTALTLTKSEGIALALLLAAAVAAGGFAHKRSRVWGGAVLASPAIVAAIGWRFWVEHHGIPPSADYRFGDVLDVSFLVGRADRLSTALAESPGYVFGTDRWLLAIPLALVAAGLVGRIRPGLAILTGSVLLFGYAGLLVIYWIGAPPVEWYIEASGERTVAPLALFAASLFPLLISDALVPRDASKG